MASGTVSGMAARSKPVDNRVAFNGKVPVGTTKIVFLYQRGKKDPCDKSKSSITV